MTLINGNSYFMTGSQEVVGSNPIFSNGGLVNGELDYNYTETTQSVGPNLFPVIYKHYHFIGKR